MEPQESPSDRRRRTHRRPRARRWAAAVAVVAALAIAAVAGVLLRERPEAPVAYRDLTTERGQRLVIALTDGSSVELNAASTLRVPLRFNADLREVTLIGEAYFDVVPDSVRPFIVRAGDATVTTPVTAPGGSPSGSPSGDPGVAFNVTGYPESERLDVAVVEGRVSVQAGPNLVVVDAGRVGRLIHSASEAPPRLSAEDTALTPFLAWRDGQLVFRDMPLGEVARALERRYDVDIELEDDALATRRLDAEFDNQRLLDVLDGVAFVLDLEYRQEDLDADRMPRRIVLYAPS